MKHPFFALAVALVAMAGLAGQEPAQIYTRPAVPAREALERLNLRMAWRTYLPSVGLRDGIHSVHLETNQVFALTKYGTVVAINLVTGATQWRVTVGEPIDITQPIVADDQFVYLVKRGLRYALRRTTGEQAPGGPAPIAAARVIGVGEEPIAFHGDTFYTIRVDNSLTAQALDGGYLLWRFSLPGRVQRRPYVTDADVFVAAEGTGLYRIDRLTGELIWTSGEATRFVAANPKFVYAMDRIGRLLILDHVRGTRLSVFDTTEFVVPISNDLTDRVFLAAHNGLLVCLHDRDYPAPLLLKAPPGAAPEEKPAATAPKGPGDGKAMEK